MIKNYWFLKLADALEAEVGVIETEAARRRRVDHVSADVDLGSARTLRVLIRVLRKVAEDA